MHKKEPAQNLFRRLIVGFNLFSLLLTAPLALRAQQTQPTTPSKPAPSLVRPTSITRPVPPGVATGAPLPAANTTAAPDEEVPIIRPQGILVETMDGRVLMEQFSNQGFNPASGVKLITALAALKTFGPDHRYTTGVWTNGTLDAATGTITGDLIISGRDPSFHYEQAVHVARELNRQGIRTVTGDLIVAPGFSMNFDPSAQRSGDQLYDTLDASRRSVAAMRAWDGYRASTGAAAEAAPSVAVMGAVYVDAVPKEARAILIHRSSRLVEVLKVLLCYSNNFMAERIGDTMGGAQGLERFLIKNLALRPEEVRLASTSGLGVNRVTPRGMMKVFRALRAELARHRLTPADILPVAGIDPGTLHKRYTSAPSRGSVIAKTGTLIRTDGGASALVGQMQTASGETLLFVIFNQRGNIWRFREAQDQLVTQLQYQHGGPKAFQYRPMTLAMRLTSTEVTPANPGRADEYEP